MNLHQNHRQAIAKDDVQLIDRQFAQNLAIAMVIPAYFPQSPSDMNSLNERMIMLKAEYSQELTQR